MGTAFSSVLRGVGAVFVGLAAGYQLFGHNTEKRTVLRPPGALDESDFIARCIRCGKCGLACPYQIIAFNDPASGATPHIIPRNGACHLCADFPCIAACPSGALSPVSDRKSVQMGTAIIDRDRCVALLGMRCEVCYRVCPFIDEAIQIEYSLRKGDEHHAIFEPVINAQLCTGCGVCEERCIISDPPAIYIKPKGC